MKRIPTVAVVLAGLLLASGLAGAVTADTGDVQMDRFTPDHDQPDAEHTSPGHDGPDAQQRLDAIADELDLTDEQRAELRETVTELREDGANRIDIRHAVLDQLAEDGYERSEVRNAIGDTVQDCQPSRVMGLQGPPVQSEGPQASADGNPDKFTPPVDSEDVGSEGDDFTPPVNGRDIGPEGDDFTPPVDSEDLGQDGDGPSPPMIDNTTDE